GGGYRQSRSTSRHLECRCRQGSGLDLLKLFAEHSTSCVAHGAHGAGQNNWRRRKRASPSTAIKQLRYQQKFSVQPFNSLGCIENGRWTQRRRSSSLGGENQHEHAARFCEDGGRGITRPFRSPCFPGTECAADENGRLRRQGVSGAV